MAIELTTVAQLTGTIGTARIPGHNAGTTGHLTPQQIVGVAHAHTAAQISDFTEASQDVVGAMVAAAGGSYNDTNGTITLPSGGSVPSNVITTDYKTPVETMDAAAAYSVVAADANKLKVSQNHPSGGASDVTVTLTVQPVGTNVRFMQGAGSKLVFAASTGVTVNAYSNLKRSAGQYATVVATVYAASTWHISGQLVA